MWRALLLAVVLAVVPSSAGAVTLVTPDGQVAQPWQSYAEMLRMPTPVATIRLNPFSCSEGVACAEPYSIWMDERWYAKHGDRHSARDDLAHELGHQFDYLVMTDRARAAFLTLMHDPRPWRSPPPESPHERFAEAYSICALPQTLDIIKGRVNAGYGYMPRLAVHRRVCALIRRTGGWFMRPSAE